MKNLCLLLCSFFLATALLTGCDSGSSDSDSASGSPYPLLKASVYSNSFYKNDSESTFKSALTVIYYTNATSYKSVSDYTVTGWDSSSAGTKTAVISYSGKSANISYTIIERPSTASILFDNWTNYIIATNTTIDIDSDTKEITLKTYNDYASFLSATTKSTKQITPTFLWADGDTASIPALYFKEGETAYYIYKTGGKMVLKTNISNVTRTITLYRTDDLIPSNGTVYVSSTTFTSGSSDYYLYIVPSSSGQSVSIYKYTTNTETPAAADKIEDFTPVSLTIEPSVIRNTSGDWTISYNNASGKLNIQAKNSSVLGTSALRCYVQTP